MKNKLLYLILFLTLLPSSAFSITAEVEDISNRKYFETLIEKISEAEESIYVCLYYIAYYGKEGMAKEAMDALVEAKKRGVEVMVILDQANVSRPYSNHLKNERAFAYLLHHGIDVYFDSLKTTTHSKVIVIDEKIVILGSTNWSNEAFQKNNEAAVISTSTELAKSFIESIDKIEKTRPAMLEKGFPIPSSFFSKEIADKLLSKKSHRGFDLYLLACKKAFETGTDIVTLNKEEIMAYIMYSLPPKSQSRFLYKLKEVTLRSLKRYGIITEYIIDYEKDTVTLTIPSLKDSPGVYLSNEYFDYTWHTRLSSKAKYAYLVLLNETRNGALGRMVSFKNRTYFNKQYGIGERTLTLAFQELQKYNLIEKTVNFDLEVPKANDYAFNDLFDMEEYGEKLLKLAHETDHDTFQLAYQTDEKLNEPYDIAVIKDFIAAIKLYGSSRFKQAAKHITRKTRLSPYRNPAFLLTTLKNDLKDKTNNFVT